MTHEREGLQRERLSASVQFCGLRGETHSENVVTAAPGDPLK